MKESIKGKFIVIEGLEGAGKSTAVSYVKEWLESKGFTSNEIVCTREPGGTQLAEKIRDITKAEVDGEELNDKAELLLMYAARTQLVEHVIKPALASGKVVIGDRHDYSTLAYQGGGRGIDLQVIKDIKQLSIGDFRADVTLYIDVTPKISLNRIEQRGELDRIERQGIEFFERVRYVFLSLITKDDNAFPINGELSRWEVKSMVRLALDNWLDSIKPNKIIFKTETGDE